MKLSIVIPCYNEETHICHNIEDILLPELNKYPLLSYEIIIVNDGSKDSTLDEINKIKGIIPISYTKNQGKGYAIKKGLEVAKGDYVLFMDADLSTKLDAFVTLNKLIQENYGMIIASRYLKDSVLPHKPPLIRRFISWNCRLIVSFLFLFHLKDTQCGFKAIRRDLVDIIVNKAIIKKFAFDIEYLYIAKLNKFEIKEFPVTWINGEKSTVRPLKSSIKFFFDLIKVRKNKSNYLN